MDQGFCAIPISQITKYNTADDIMLNLLENYLIKMQFFKDTRSKNIHDFGNMLQVSDVDVDSE